MSCVRKENAYYYGEGQKCDKHKYFTILLYQLYVSIF